jgi:hypothetical protein
MSFYFVLRNNYRMKEEEGGYAQAEEGEGENKRQTQWGCGRGGRCLGEGFVFMLSLMLIKTACS